MESVKTGRIQVKVPNISNTPKESRLYADDYDVDDVTWVEMQYDDELEPCTCGCQDKIEIVTDDPDQFQKAHKYDAGYDILASSDTLIQAQDKALIPTGLRVGIPRGFVGVIKSRSGLASKHALEVGAGVIDYGYTGEVKVLIHNHHHSNYGIRAGDKIAQMVIVPICQLPVKLVGRLKDSERAEKGFNSSGYKSKNTK